MAFETYNTTKIDNLINDIRQLPAFPTTDGDYTLYCKVENGAVTRFEWINNL